MPAAVIEVEAASRKLTLSVVDYFKNKEDAEWKSYLSAHKPNSSLDYFFCVMGTPARSQE